MFLLIARYLIILLVLVLIPFVIYQFIQKPDKSAVVDAKTRNYAIRFDPESNKYFIVNILSTKEVPVKTWYGRTIKYKDMIMADYVLQKLNM